MAVVKAVSFKDSERELIEFIKNKDFSYYVKELIRKDMKENEPQLPKRKKKFDFEF